MRERERERERGVRGYVFASLLIGNMLFISFRFASLIETLRNGFYKRGVRRKGQIGMSIRIDYKKLTIESSFNFQDHACNRPIV